MIKKVYPVLLSKFLFFLAAHQHILDARSTDISHNLLKISAGDTEAFKKVTDEFAARMQNLRAWGLS